MRAICIGECMLELRQLEAERYALGFAGDVYNTAVHLKRQAPELDVQFATVTGDDSLSARMRAEWRRQGLGEGLAFEAHGTPGLYLIELEAGERHFHYWRSASPARGWLRELLARGGEAALAGADLVYLSGISLAILPDEDQPAAVELLRRLKGRAGLIAIDPNVRPKLWPSLDRAREIIGAAADAADIVLPSLDDLTALGWDIDNLPGEAAVTAGADGCRIRIDGRWEHLPPPPSDVRDTSGAGDAFNGAYLAARLHGAPPLAAAEAGLALAARNVAVFGALPDLQMFRRSESPSTGGSTGEAGEGG